MRFVSWNVNGIRAVLKKNFLEVFDAFNADIFAIQETKCQVGQVELDLPGYHQYWSAAEKKGYSGTAVFTREEPLRVLHGLGNEYLDAEGRIVACEFPQFWFVNVYTPNSQMELARIDHRMEWDDAFRDFCKGLEAGVLPDGKADFVRELQEQGRVVAMVGDGINDSAALAQADLGIAMGRGSDIAMDVAKMTIVSSDLTKIPVAIRISAQTVRTIRQNLFWAFIYNVIGVPVAAGILYPVNGFLLNPMIAGAAMALSSVSVVTNSLRLKWKK